VQTLAVLAEQPNVLSVDASAVVVFVTALVLIWVLNALLFKPVGHVLDERDRRTRGYESEAKAILAECEHKLHRYEAALRQARADNYALLEHRRKEALQRRADLIGATKQEVGQQVGEARRQIQDQLTSAKAQLEQDVPAIAGRIASRVLGRSVGGGA
jgi:F-type H+-transporting ATPase subunit b